MDNIYFPRSNCNTPRTRAVHAVLSSRLCHGAAAARQNPRQFRLSYLNDPRAIADVTLDPNTGRIAVGRVVVADESDLVIHPDGLKNQIEANAIQSLGRPPHEQVSFDTAHVTGRKRVGHPILRFEKIPDRIDIVLVDNTPNKTSTWGDAPSSHPTAVVISNAVHDAIGAPGPDTLPSGARSLIAFHTPRLLPRLR